MSNLDHNTSFIVRITINEAIVMHSYCVIINAKITGIHAPHAA